MISLTLATVLAFSFDTLDAGQSDAGFVPVVLDVNRGALWTNLADGGVSDAPVLVHGGIYEDDQTAMLTGKSAARGTAVEAVPPNPNPTIILAVGGVMLIIGAVAGFLGGLAAAKKF